MNKTLKVTLFFFIAILLVTLVYALSISSVGNQVVNGYLNVTGLVYAKNNVNITNDIVNVRTIYFKNDHIAHNITDSTTCMYIYGDTATLKVC